MAAKTFLLDFTVLQVFPVLMRKRTTSSCKLGKAWGLILSVAVLLLPLQRMRFHFFCTHALIKPDLDLI